MEYAITGNDVNVNDQPNRMRNPLGSTESDDPKRTRNKEIVSSKITDRTEIRKNDEFEKAQRRKMTEIIDLGKYKNIIKNDEASKVTNKSIKPTIVENEGKWNTIQRRKPRKLQQTLSGTCTVTN
ncbi:hypothetical protein WA026_021308 [Henosepilachna vigintioctopunctata]|uniref:Uncharacterized protein n=1 Tax=Henosepilachna vigintioctopunctata TaxID=420089 RepID=A0AAW1U3M1_9CUCU